MRLVHSGFSFGLPYRRSGRYDYTSRGQVVKYRNAGLCLARITTRAKLC